MIAIGELCTLRTDLFSQVNDYGYHMMYTNTDVRQTVLKLIHSNTHNEVSTKELTRHAQMNLNTF